MVTMDGTNTHDMKIAKNLMLHELHNIQKQRQWGSSNFKRQKKGGAAEFRRILDGAGKI